jgi:hypothetical protein
MDGAKQPRPSYPAGGRRSSRQTVLSEHKENMINAKPTIKIELTPEQKDQVRQRTGEPKPTVKLQLQELDGRVAPAIIIA